MNGQNVSTAPIAEILQMLNSRSQAKLVLMRDMDDGDRGPDLEDMERLNEHLEAIEGDNTRLMEEVNRQVPCCPQTQILYIVIHNTVNSNRLPD